MQKDVRIERGKILWVQGRLVEANRNQAHRPLRHGESSSSNKARKGVKGYWGEGRTES